MSCGYYSHVKMEEKKKKFNFSEVQSKVFEKDILFVHSLVNHIHKYHFILDMPLYLGYHLYSYHTMVLVYTYAF